MKNERDFTAKKSEGLKVVNVAGSVEWVNVEDPNAKYAK